MICSDDIVIEMLLHLEMSNKPKNDYLSARRPTNITLNQIKNTTY